MATKKWFVVAGANELGPLGPRGIRKLVRAGEIKPETKIRREDHETPVRADQLRGLFPGEHAAASHSQALPNLPGPFTSLRVLGLCTAAAMAAWAIVGAWGAFAAWSQRNTALEIAAGANRPLLDAGAPFLGLGGVVALVLFAATGVLFGYWLWSARANLPHLIHARIRFAPSWTIASWFVPIVNLLQPYEVIEEVDRLSCQAAADGDATRRAEPMLLVPWWLGTLLLVGFATWYKLAAVATAQQIASAAVLHLGASVALVFAAGFAAAIVLRITRAQERAHAVHSGPVRVHHEFGKHHKSAEIT